MHWLIERLTVGGMWLLFEIGRLAVKTFPRRFLISLSAALANFGFYLFHGFRKRSIHNLRLALGDQRDQREIRTMVRLSLRNFFRDFVEIGFVLEATTEETRAEIPLRGREHLEAALGKGKGAIALSAHLGNFFLVGTRLAAEGFPSYVLVNPPRNLRLSQLMNRYRLMVGQRTIHSRPRRQASQELVQLLRRNEVVMVIADEFRTGSGICVPLFGRTVLARRGPATLALRTGAALVPVYLVREPGDQLNLIIEPEIELSKTGDIKADVRENTLRITQWLERTVRSYPDQWNWMNVNWQHGSLGALIGKEHRYEEVAH